MIIRNFMYFDEISRHFVSPPAKKFIFAKRDKFLQYSNFLNCHAHLLRSYTKFREISRKHIFSQNRFSNYFREIRSKSHMSKIFSLKWSRFYMLRKILALFLRKLQNSTYLIFAYFHKQIFAKMRKWFQFQFIHFHSGHNRWIFDIPDMQFACQYCLLSVVNREVQNGVVGCPSLINVRDR